VAGFVLASLVQMVPLAPAVGTSTSVAITRPQAYERPRWAELGRAGPVPVSAAKVVWFIERHRTTAQSPASTYFSSTWVGRTDHACSAPSITKSGGIDTRCYTRSGEPHQARCGEQVGHATQSEPDGLKLPWSWWVRALRSAATTLVGAADHGGTEGRHDDRLADFSSVGDPLRTPDVLAPGRSVVSLRAPGSWLDERPSLTPDQVKHILRRGATPIAGQRSAQGAGLINLKDSQKIDPRRAPQQAFAPATGLGLLELSRGGSHVADAVTGEELVGERDIFGRPFVASSWAAAAAAVTAWNGGTWNGGTWAGPGWGGVSFAGKTWRDAAWLDGNWAGKTWRADLWSGKTWRDSTWTGKTWRDATWSGKTWRDSAWTGRVWR